MNSYVLVIRMLYQLATYEATAYFENGIVKGDYTDILDHCDNLSTSPFLLVANCSYCRCYG